MEEVNLKEMFSYFLSKYLLIILFVVLGAGACIVYSLFIQKPMYNSYTTVVLARSSDSASNNGTLQSDVTTNQKLVSTYREIIKSRRILNQVISNLDLNMSYETLHNMVSVTNEKDTELIKIAVNSQNSKDAKDIANEIAKVFSKEIESIYEIKNLSIIDYADENTIPYNNNVPKQMVISVLVSFVLACGIIFVMFYFDTTIKSSEEIEEKIGLPVLGVVPFKPNLKGGNK